MVEAGPGARRPHLAPPAPSHGFPSVFDLDTAGPQQAIEPLSRRRAGLTAQPLPTGRHPRHERLQEAMFERPRQADRIPYGWPAEAMAAGTAPRKTMARRAGPGVRGGRIAPCPEPPASAPAGLGIT